MSGIYIIDYTLIIHQSMKLCAMSIFLMWPSLLIADCHSFSTPMTFLGMTQPHSSFSQPATPLYQSMVDDADADADNNDNSAMDSSLASFKSEPMQLYIEDTDAYGVKYNGNYIRSYERALHQHSHINQNANFSKDDECQQEKVPMLIRDKNFHLTKVSRHKFKSSPTLGSSYYITGKLIDVNVGIVDAHPEETWSLEMMHCDDIKTDTGKTKLYNTAFVTITPSSNTNIHASAISSSTDAIASFHPGTKAIFQDAFTVHRDEFDVNMPNAIPIRTVLNLFERQRSNGLGGPQVLKQMQDEYNLLWVVTSIDDLNIHQSNGDGNVIVKPGMKVLVRSFFEVKRRGMILEFQQEVVAVDDDEDKEVILAQGCVTICAIDSIKGRPTNNIPQHVRDMFEKI
jgi:acyl-CoA thioesterase FadM